jgi:hypothetical protein
MSSRRLVRVAPSFFERLDELLPGERSATGTPSATDFLLHDLPTILDRLAEDYESATLAVPSLPGVRVLIAAGALVPTFAVYTVVAADEAVEVIHLELDDIPG